MRLNDDFTRPLIISASSQTWSPSPVEGVDRRMLFRTGLESGCATSIVRFRPNSRFPQHTHHGGEEIFVLEGIFQDEHGDYPAGTYIRNPRGTSHVPFSNEGCTIFVKLGQLESKDDRQAVHRTVMNAEPTQSAWVDEIYRGVDEIIILQQWPSDFSISPSNDRGLEFLIVSGSVTVGDSELPAQTWGRLPAGRNLQCRSGSDAARLLLRFAPIYSNEFS